MFTFLIGVFVGVVLMAWHFSGAKVTWYPSR